MVSEEVPPDLLWTDVWVVAVGRTVPIGETSRLDKSQALSSAFLPSPTPVEFMSSSKENRRNLH